MKKANKCVAELEEREAKLTELEENLKDASFLEKQFEFKTFAKELADDGFNYTMTKQKYSILS